MNLNFSDSANKCDSSLYDGRENLLLGLTGLSTATSKLLCFRQSSELLEALDRLNTISKDIETTGAELATKRTFNCR